MPTYPTEIVSLDDALEHLNLPDSVNTDEVQGFIDAATAYVQNATGPIIAQTFTETHSGGASSICLFNPPILEVTSVVEYVAATGYTLTQVALGDTAGQYSFSLDDPKSGVLRRRYNGNLVGPFACGDHNIAVTYIAGQATVPADIRMAVLQDIAGLYGPSQRGGNPYNNSADALGRVNPVGMFPRLAAILSAPSLRTPSIG